MPRVPSVRKMISLAVLFAILLTVVPALPAGAAQGIKATNEWVNFYGLSTTLGGAPIPVGATVTAYDPSGVLCGQFVVHTAGQYGVMPVYRDDAMTADDEGAQPGDVINFKINGQVATVAGPDTPTWTANGAVIHVELATGGAAPTATQPAAATATATPVGPAATPTSSNGSSPEWVNFYGTNSTLDALPLPVGAVVEAWSADGARCGAFTVTTAGSYGVLACQRSAAGSAGMQPGGTVYFTVNGRAALPLGPDAATWTSQGDRRHVELEVPPLTPIPPTVGAPSPTPTTSGGTAPEWVNFYGTSSTLNGAPLPVGALVEAFSPGGTRCGSFTVTTAGSYGVMACERGTGAGAQPGQTISFKINGQAATALGPDSAVWTSHGDRRHVELSVSSAPPTPQPSATPTSTGGESPQWVNFYGTASILEGLPLPVGAMVVAWSPDGVQCGSFTVTTAGSYGLLACLGAAVGLPGAHVGDTIYFTINGRAALTTGPDTAVWTSNGDRRHVELQIPAATATPTAPAGATPTSTTVAPAPTATATSVPGATATVTRAATATATRTTAPGATATRTGTPTPVPPGGPCTGITYTVKWGDYLIKIAKQYGVSVADLTRCNVLPNPNLLRPGQQLLIPTVATATPTPATSRTPTPLPSPTPCSNVYYVRCGDTLTRIAARYGTTVRAIMDANGLVNPNYIYIGQRLAIPGGACGTPTPPPGQRTYVVRYGDTLSAIAVRYGVNVYALAVANNLYYPYIIYPGQRLVIP